MPPVKAEVPEYRRHTLDCPHCGASTRAEWPEEMPSGCFGPRAQAIVGYLTGRLALSHRDVVEAIKTLHGLSLGLESVSAIQRQVSHAPEQPVNHVDETGWPEGDKQKAMAKSRKAKPVGLIPVHLPSLTAGPLGHNDAGHPNRPRLLLGDTPGPLGTNDHGDPNLRKPFGASSQSNQLRMDPLFEEAYWKVCAFAANSVLVTEADEAEFNLFEGKIEDRNVAEYVKHRTEFFGSTAAYRAYAAESDEEHREAKYRESQIEFRGEAEKVFYRWVRKAYENIGVEDVPNMIKSGQSDELRQELAKVRAAYGRGFHAGGFNPRPKKKNNKYRLGTISEHATGMAVDIEDKKNPQLVLSQWKFIEKLAGKTVDLSLARWWEKPKDMWQDVKDLNDKFVAKVQAEVARIQKANGAPKNKDHALAEIFKGDREIEKLREWADGFFTLEWALVEQLHKHHFRWGATFYPGNIDLHHFELAGGKKEK